MVEENTERVEPFKKVMVELEAGTVPESMDLSSEPFPFEFIFGLGRNGLTPFECDLSDMGEGESVTLFVRAEECPGIFQHLRVPFPGAAEEKGAFYLKVNIRKIVQADQREVISALAEIANCGDHCCGH